MDSLDGMVVFTGVVKAGSFTAAARQLRISKSAVSKQIARLEDRLGARLLNRTTRRLALTEAGTLFYDRCSRIVAEAEEAELLVSRLQDTPRGTLRVDASLSFGIRHIAPAITDFMAQYPELSIDLTLNDQFIDVVESGVDVVIRIAGLADSSLFARRLAPSRVVLCGSPEYIRAHGVPRHPQDLTRYNCLLYTNLEAPADWTFQGPDGPVSVRVSGTLRSNNGDFTRKVLLNGLGIARMPSFLVGEDLKAGRLQCLLPGYSTRSATPGPEPSVYAVYPHNRHLSAKVRAFVDFLVERFGPSPPWDDWLGGGAEKSL